MIERWTTYGQDTQKGGFASILQADHGYVHFGCPARGQLEYPRRRTKDGTKRGCIPEETQEPVIDALEEAGHWIVLSLWTGTAAVVRLDGIPVAS